MRQIAHARPAVLFIHRDAQQAQIAHLGPQLVGKGVGAVGFGRQGRDAIGGPSVDHLAQRVHILAQIEFHAPREHRDPPPRLLNACSFL